MFNKDLKHSGASGGRRFGGVLAGLLLVGCSQTGDPAIERVPAGALSATEIVASGLDRPLDLRFDAQGRMLAVEQGGLARWIEDGEPVEPPLVDLRDRIYAEGKRGLLGLALHPDFANNGRLFLKYNPMDALEPGHRVVLARFQRAPGASSVDLGAEMRYIALDKITELHDGGAPVFGPAGRLYVAFGDGGPHEDPVHAQDAETLLGSLLRVDVPADDTIEAMTGDPRPFLGSPPAILAIGLRNPWRYSFDRATGDLMIADVGYETREEVSRLSARALEEASNRPLNLGWPCFEGSVPYLDDGRCDGRELTAPVLEYGHDQGFAITGGFVYRGSEMNALIGRYVYGDFVNGRIWSVDAEALESGPLSPDANPLESRIQPALARHLNARLELESGLNIAGFGEDPAGELYLISYADGTVRKLRWNAH